MSRAISFDGNDLQTATILTSEINNESIPTKDVQIHALAHANKSAVAHVNYPSKTITVSGKVLAASISALDTALDAFRAYFNKKEANLDIEYAGATRRWIATENGTSINRPNGLQHADFTIQFVCSSPFGADTSLSELLSASAVTSIPETNTLAVAGTSPVQFPIITITINSVTDGDATITVSNDEKGQALTITADFSSSDVIVIDSYTRETTINDVVVDTSGAYPVFGLGNSDFTYSDTFTARDVDVDVDYYKRYL